MHQIMHHAPAHTLVHGCGGECPRYYFHKFASPASLLLTELSRGCRHCRLGDHQITLIELHFPDCDVMKRTAILLLCFSVGGRYHADAFVFGVFAGQNPRCQATSKLRSRVHNDADFDADDNIIERRAFFQSIVAAVAVTAGTISSSAVSPALAADNLGPTIWNSGKEPKVPGKKPRDKNDTSGTRKDPSFLRSISDCKNTCQNTTGPDGFARSKEECLSDCQDVCCKTYEQCTFAIVPRI